MADKTLNTRISLKYGAIGEWTSGFQPLKGEVCFAEVTTKQKDAAGNIIDVPAVVFKVGDGTKTFGELPWASALAADVYEWAKAEHLALNVTEADGVNDSKYVNGLVWDSTTHTFKPQMVSFDTVIDDSTKDSTNAPTTQAVKTYVDAEVQKAVSGGVEGLATEKYVNDAIDALSAEGGAIKAVADDLADHEQAFEEFQTANTQAIANAKTGAETTAANALATARTEISNEIDADVKVAKDRADEAYTLANGKTTMAEVEAKDYATNTALNGVKATAEQGVADAAAAKGVADAAKARIDAFIDGTAEADSAIDTLVEIQQYMTTDTEAFTALSGRVTTLESKPGLDKVGTVTSIIAGDGLDGGTITETGTIALNAATKASLAKADTALQTHQDISHLATEADLTLAENRITALEGKPAANITATQIENWDGEVGAKALAGTKTTTAEVKTQIEAYGYATEADLTLAENRITTLENKDYILNGDTVILDCGGAE